jgi:hypothetical protein
LLVVSCVYWELYRATPRSDSAPVGPTAMPYAITAFIRLALIHALQHTLLATQTSAVAITTCLDYRHPHTRTMRSSTAPVDLCTCSQRVLGAVPSPLALAETGQHTLLATQTSAVVTTRFISRLSALAYTDDALIHGLADGPLHLLSTDIGCGTHAAPRSQTTHGNTHCWRLKPRQW